MATEVLEQPVSAGEGDQGALMTTDAQAAYLDLMGAYNRALAGASRVETAHDEWASAGLVRVMVGSHIRVRLRALGAAYGQLAAAVGDREGCDWLNAARDDCEWIASRLPAVRLRPLVLGVVPPAGALLSTRIPGWVGYALLALSGAIVVFLLVGYLTVRNSYRCKRELLMPGATAVDKMEKEEQERFAPPEISIRDNTYLAEDRAFAAVHRGKRREVQVDRSLRILGWTLLGEAFVLAPLFLWDGRYWWISAAATVVALAGFALIGKLERERVWI